MIDDDPSTKGQQLKGPGDCFEIGLSLIDAAVFLAATSFDVSHDATVRD